MNIKKKICIIGSGYVGLALALEFGKFHHVKCFDINVKKIEELQLSIDSNGEFTQSDFQLCSDLSFTHTKGDCTGYDFYIVTVPTPIYLDGRPDLRPLISASKFVGEVMASGSIVIYESTVYPGATEEVCLPVLITNSKLKYPDQFNIAYSPERINPGDKSRPLRLITKVVSSDNESSLKKVVNLYSSIIEAGLHVAPNIQVAEASKVIENTQRDVNIALINELLLIFDRLNISTYDVLEASATKWNFINLRPGLVGGHCISVDPHYLTFKAENVGYLSKVISSGRAINDHMPVFFSQKFINLMPSHIKGDILILGCTFKENCSDIRNTKVANLIHEIRNVYENVTIFDPHACPIEMDREYGICIVNTAPSYAEYNGFILAVPHDSILKDINLHLNEFNSCLFFDISNKAKLYKFNKSVMYWSP